MTDLIEFLNARLNEDEQTAARLRSELWWIGNVTLIKAYAGQPGDRILFEDPGVDGRTVPVTEAIQRGLLAGNPDRLLREVDAKRRIVDRYAWLREHGDTGDAAWVLPLLALPYSDHPDYRQEWTP